MSIEAGTLYVVATPIGNLEDITQRALRVLAAVDVVAAEDTRHTGRLLRHYGIATPLTPLHEHNERQAVRRLLERLRRGEAVALVSDAGTPLISDPGYHLVRAVWAAGLRVAPVPGPSAMVAALSVSGLPADRFAFEGFLPPRPEARRRRLEALRGEARTLVFYEAPHRAAASLADMARILGAAREAAYCRELTKAFETVRRGPLGELAAWVAAEARQRKGEIVVLVHGAAPETAGRQEVRRVLHVLREALPTSQAVALCARITGARRREVYALAQEGGEGNPRAAPRS